MSPARRLAVPALLLLCFCAATALPLQRLPNEGITNTTAPCAPITINVLLRVLGSAYNDRYMAVLSPKGVRTDRVDRSRPGLHLGVGPELSEANWEEDGGALADDAEDFAVPADYRRTISDVPAWLYEERVLADDSLATSTSNHSEVLGSGSPRRKARQASYNPTPWACRTHVAWDDLGPDYFPRFLRNVDCGERRRCWYDKFECRPRSFPTRLLRRVPGKCAPPPPGSPSEVGTELWLWEERAVAFCCECAPVM